MTKMQTRDATAPKVWAVQPCLEFCILQEYLVYTTQLFYLCFFSILDINLSKWFPEPNGNLPKAQPKNCRGSFFLSLITCGQQTPCNGVDGKGLSCRDLTGATVLTDERYISKTVCTYTHRQSWEELLSAKIRENTCFAVPRMCSKFFVDCV